MTQPLLSVVVHDLVSRPGLTGLCAGFEGGRWRAAALADELMKALPEFCLTYTEYSTLTHENAVQLLREVALRVYQTERFKKRGEFGELLLHVILRQVFETIPAISKIYYKDSANDTVKGFDAVHVVVAANSLELWLGEAKFYDDITAAISAVRAELEKHTKVDYLRNEFIAIKTKIDNGWPHADKLRRLLHENTSLDTVFDSSCIPVLLTYDGKVTGRHKKDGDVYRSELITELRDIHQRFAKTGLPKNLKIHLLLVPLSTKTLLLTALDEKLKAWQQI